jgi:RNA recognition motif-containing protein
MMVKLFVGNLPWSVGDAELTALFAPHGEVQSARVINDRDTGRSRGFGFVEMEADNVADVIRATDGKEIDGRNVRVNEAENKDRGDRGGSRNDRGGFGGGGRRDRY